MELCSGGLCHLPRHPSPVLARSSGAHGWWGLLLLLQLWYILAHAKAEVVQGKDEDVGQLVFYLALNAKNN